MASELDPARTDWRGDFRAAEERLLDASLSATPSQRLKWLEEALAFAARMGALPLVERRGFSPPGSRESSAG